MQRVNRQIIYIAGYGRSGSTILDILLSYHPDIEGCGEVSNLFNVYDDVQMRTDFWRSLVKDLNISEKKFHKNSILFQSWYFIKVLGFYSQYKSVWRKVFNSIFEATESTLLVDSSKTTNYSFFRPMYLKGMGYDIVMIHLVRDVRAVMYSEGTKGSNVKLEQGVSNPRKTGGEIRVLLSWIWTNIATTIFYKILLGNKYMIIRYNDLVINPKQTLERIGVFLGLDKSSFESLPIKIPIGDFGISGNRVRRRKEITLQYDQTWKKKLPKKYKVLSYMAKPLSILYGL